MASLVIGITGKKRSGKDTFAARLISHHGFTQVRFADPLRAMAKALDPIVDTYRATPYVSQDIRLSDVLGPDDDWETAKELPEVRRLLQRIGTEAGREVLGEDVWVNAALWAIQSVPGPVVLTDTRFPNEARLVADCNGTLVRIVRPGLVSTDEHASETALDAWVANTVIRNDGTVEDLHEAADALAAEHIQ